MVKIKEALTILDNSGHHVSKTELLLAVFSDFEREAALENSAFLWVKCFIHIRYYDMC